MERIQPLSRTWPLFAGVALALGMGSFDGASVQGIFPYVAGGLSTSNDHALWTLTYFIVHWSLGITLMPWTTQRFGMRRVFQMAVMVAGIGTIISATTSNLWIMLLSRALEGIAAGLLVPLSQSLFLRHSPERQHGLVTIFWSNAMLVPFFSGRPWAVFWLQTSVIAVFFCFPCLSGYWHYCSVAVVSPKIRVEKTCHPLTAGDSACSTPG
ncbi:MFS transporter [Acidithiobacillus thiooxidans]|uniref:MFS transporter n=1 Tax=Acidithiobacillus thiooxidans TaxID=930 RepID=UPI000A72EB84